MTGSIPFDDQSAIELLEDAADFHAKLRTELNRLGPNEKSAIWRNVSAFATQTARNLGCKTSDIIWGKSEPASVEQLYAILSAIKLLFKRGFPPFDQAEYTALVILRAMASISYAEGLAKHEGVKKQAQQLKLDFGERIDEILEQK